MRIVPLVEALDAAEFGGKAFNLGAALRAGLPVPPGYAVSVAALDAIARRDATLIDRVRADVTSLGFPVAARSSAVGEDAEEASFAGQHITALNLTSADETIAGLVRVHDSAHAEAALAYRSKKGITAPVRIAAVVQKLVDPDCAGVLFTRNPVSASGGGTVEEEVEPALVHARCLDDAWLGRLVELATRCEKHFGEQLDLEWARVDGDLLLLQSRPISTGRR